MIAEVLIKNNNNNNKISNDKKESKKAIWEKAMQYKVSHAILFSHQGNKPCSMSDGHSSICLSQCKY